MPRFLLLLALAFGLTGVQADAKTHRFEEHDLEFTAPSDWLASEPEIGVVVVLHDQIPEKIGGDTSRGSKAVALMVTNFLQGVAIDPEDFVSKQRQDLLQRGALLVGTGEEGVGPLLFHTAKFSTSDEPDRPVSFLCTAFGNDRAVTLILSSRVIDPSKDPQLDAILRSVHFLSPYRPIPELTTWLRVKAFTRRHPIAVVLMGLAGLAALAILGLIVKQSTVDGRKK